MTIIVRMSVIHWRWRPPKLICDDLEQAAGLIDMIPKETLDERLHQLQSLVRAKCPSSHAEYYVFVFIITCIVFSVAFSLAAQSANISMWYPLILLLIPAALSYWMSRRRSTLLYRIKEFEHLLKQTLIQFNKKDKMYHVRWSFRRPTRHDTLPVQYRTACPCLVVELAQCLDMAEIDILDETLPSYQAATGQLDDLSDAALPPSYSESNLQQLQHSSGISSTLTSVMDHPRTLSANGTINTSIYPSCNSSTTHLLTIPEAALTRSSSHQHT